MSDLLRKYLKDYIVFNETDVDIAISKGEATLSNLRLKPGALDALNLPIEVQFGYIGEMRLKIPFSNLSQVRCVGCFRIVLLRICSMSACQLSGCTLPPRARVSSLASSSSPLRDAHHAGAVRGRGRPRFSRRALASAPRRRPARRQRRSGTCHTRQ